MKKFEKKISNKFQVCVTPAVAPPVGVDYYCRTWRRRRASHCIRPYNNNIFSSVVRTKRTEHNRGLPAMYRTYLRIAHYKDYWKFEKHPKTVCVYAVVAKSRRDPIRGLCERSQYSQTDWVRYTKIDIYLLALFPKIFYLIFLKNPVWRLKMNQPINLHENKKQIDKRKRIKYLHIQVVLMSAVSSLTVFT